MFNKFTLKNGLSLITAPKPGTQAVTVLVLLPVGSRYETKNLNGVSHFIEHLMFKGTDKRPTSLDLTKELDSVGAEFNAFTAKDHTGYFIKIAADKVELAFDILSDMIFHSKIDAAELEKERGVIVEEINMYEDNPLMYIESLFEETVFGSQPLGWQIYGPASVIKKVSRDSLINYLKSHYAPANLHLTVAGNFNENTVKKLAQKYFGAKRGQATEDIFRRGSKSAAESATPRRGSGTSEFKKYKGKQTKPQVTLKFKDTQQVQLCLGFPAYHYQHQDINVLHLLEIILGGNMSSRLFTKIREHHGLAYFIQASTNIYQDTGNFVIQAGLDKARIFKAIELILDEIEKIKVGGVTAEELKNAQEFLAGKITLELEDSESVAAWYAKQELLIGKILTPEQHLKKVKQVKIVDLGRVANDILKSEKINLALIGPFKEQGSFNRLLKI